MDRRYLVTCPWVSGEESQVANRRQIILPTPFPHMWPANDGTQAALNAGTAKMNLDPIPMPPTAQPPSAAHGPFVRGFRQRRGEALPIAGEAAFVWRRIWRFRMRVSPALSLPPTAGAKRARRDAC
jgi:hypothetical protein